MIGEKMSELTIMTISLLCAMVAFVLTPLVMKRKGIHCMP